MSWLDTLEDIRKKDFSSATDAEREKAAKDVVNMASYACAMVAVSPIPFTDAAISLPMQSAMVITLGHIHGRNLTKSAAKELIVELGTTAGLGLVARQGIKLLLPVVGALLTVPAAFAANWAIGKVATEYFKNPTMTKDQFKKVYESAIQEGKKLFSKERFDAFRKKEKPTKETNTTIPNEKTDTSSEKSNAQSPGQIKGKAGKATIKRKP